MTDQVVPRSSSANASVLLVGVVYLPTATQVPGAAQEVEKSRKYPVWPGFGLVATVQIVGLASAAVVVKMPLTRTAVRTSAAAPDARTGRGRPPTDPVRRS